MDNHQEPPIFSPLLDGYLTLGRETKLYSVKQDSRIPIQRMAAIPFAKHALVGVTHLYEFYMICVYLSTGRLRKERP
jgi:hypothetical protein